MGTENQFEVTVGCFTYKNNGLTGPQRYMTHRCRNLLKSIKAGQDPLIKIIARQIPDWATGLLTRMQIDYDEWNGIVKAITTIGSERRN